jgi:hypothetical protein
MARRVYLYKNLSIMAWVIVNDGWIRGVTASGVGSQIGHLIRGLGSARDLFA